MHKFTSLSHTDLSPRVVIVRLGKLQVGNPQGLDLQVLALELGPHAELLPAPPEAGGAFAILSHHRRVVRDLLGNALEALVIRPVQLVGLSQERIERLATSDGCCAVGRHGEGCHKGHLLTIVLATSSLVQDLAVLIIFGKSAKARP